MKTRRLLYTVPYGSMIGGLMIIALMIGLAILPMQLSAADAAAPDKFFNAPVMPGGADAGSDGSRVQLAYDLPYETVLAWYKEALKNYKDEKFRDWEDQMYIEDQGGAKWHSIGISKGGGNKTTVTIVKDNWTWIFSTLLIRFAGVFIILLALWVLLNISNAIMKRAFANETVKPKA
jgi:hypothetical protein